MLLVIAGASNRISVFLLKKLWKWRIGDKAQWNGNSIPITDVDINMSDLQQIGALLAIAYAMVKKGSFRVSSPEDIPSCFPQFSPIFLLRQQISQISTANLSALMLDRPFPLSNTRRLWGDSWFPRSWVEQSLHWRIRTSDCSALKPVHVQSQNT